MKIFEGSTVLLMVVLGILTLGGLVSIKFFGPDNPIEELVEDIIEKETGFKIDLSPEQDKGTGVPYSSNDLIYSKDC